MKVSNFFSVIILVILLFIGYTAYRHSKSLKQEIQRLEMNFDAVLLKTDSLKRTINILPQQLATHFPHIDSITKLINVKPKNVQQITHVSNSFYSTDTVVIEILPDNDTIYYSYSDTLGCFTFNTLIDLINDNVKVFDLTADNQIYIVDYARRKKLFARSWLPSWGQWQYFRETKSSCTGQVTTQEYKIHKNRPERKNR